MSSFIYPSSVPALAVGNINFGTDKFAVVLLDNSHRPNEDDSALDDLDGEISGQNYARKDVDVNVLVDVDGQTTIVLGGAVWKNSSLTAHFAAYFRKASRLADEHLVALIDFGKDVQSLNDLFSLTDSEIEIFTRAEP